MINKNYKLWLHEKSAAPNDYISVSSCEEAIEIVKKHGPPTEISVAGDDALPFLRWLDANHHHHIPKWNVRSDDADANEFLSSWQKMVGDSWENQ